ncbi:MAG TPA: hypothetical protein VMH47_06915 [Gaiellaceae bacterium]|nr:hypothetical protein [Gaiellaceae bacterium]
MPTRKQRRRREKDFRHDMRIYEVDEEGNEVAISELRTREEPEKSAAKQEKQQTKQSRQAKSRGIREVPPPSWQRAIKRGGLMGVATLAVFVFLLKSAPITQRLAIGIFYAVAFVPLTYWIDRTAYRSYQKRIARAAGGDAKAKPASKKS